jgi:hypothetical protein
VCGSSHKGEIDVPANKSKTPNLFDPEALLEAQRRNFTAFTSAGNIVATGMRSYAERQVTMMQESMKQLWSVMQASAAKATPGAAPTQQMEQMRSAFEKVLAQVNDLGNHLLKVQSEAMAVLNECASKNFEVLGGAAPELAALQQKAKDAFASASTQTTAVIDEMKKRMASLEEETKSAVETPTAASDEAAPDEVESPPPATPRPRAPRARKPKA